MISFPSLRVNNSSQFLDTSSIRIGLKFISVLTSAKICSFCLSRRILIRSFSMSRPDFRFWNELGSYRSLTVLVCAKTDWAGNKLSQRVISLSQVRWFFPLLNEQWWRWRFSDSLIVEFRIERVRKLRIYVVGFILEDHRRTLWVVEVVEELGLITCERVVYRHGSILLMVRECSGFNPRRFRRGRQWDKK